MPDYLFQKNRLLIIRLVAVFITGSTIIACSEQEDSLPEPYQQTTIDRAPTDAEIEKLRDEIVTEMCSDGSEYRRSGESSIECINTYHEYSEMCIENVSPEFPIAISTTSFVEYSKAYSECLANARAAK